MQLREDIEQGLSRISAPRASLTLIPLKAQRVKR